MDSRPGWVSLWSQWARFLREASVCTVRVEYVCSLDDCVWIRRGGFSGGHDAIGGGGLASAWQPSFNNSLSPFASTGPDQRWGSPLHAPACLPALHCMTLSWMHFGYPDICMHLRTFCRFPRGSALNAVTEKLPFPNLRMFPSLTAGILWGLKVTGTLLEEPLSGDLPRFFFLIFGGWGQGVTSCWKFVHRISRMSILEI